MTSRRIFPRVMRVDTLSIFAWRRAAISWLAPQQRLSPMDQLPIYLDLTGRPCLVAGGGAVAARKTALLLRAGARVTVVAPRLDEALARLYERGDIAYVAAEFDPAHLAGARLVIAATGDGAANKTIAAAADEANVLCNAVDDAGASSFIFPAIVDRSPVVIAIGTGGNAPVLAQALKARIERLIPARIGALAAFAGRFRERVKRRFDTLTERRRYWQRFFDGPIAEHVLANRMRSAETLARRALVQRVHPPAEPAGEAYIVGAGPGDPGLVTIRAQQLIRQADVVLYDRLVAPGILDYARKEAEQVAVGKAPGEREDRQEDINRALIALVRAGKRVCRLKGGDPFIFGRGGEEAQALKRAGLPYQVVPGVSAALGCAAYAGIPLTQRGVSGSVTFATAKLAAGMAPEWRALAKAGHTLALYMSAGSLGETAAALLAEGLPPATPAAIVENGTRTQQRVLQTTLAGLEDAANVNAIRAPAMLFVGATAALGRELAWFESEGGPGESLRAAPADLFSGLPVRA